MGLPKKACTVHNFSTPSLSGVVVVGSWQPHVCGKIKVVENGGEERNFLCRGTAGHIVETTT